MKFLIDPFTIKVVVLVVLAALSTLTMLLCSKPLRQAGLNSIISYEIVIKPGEATKLWNSIGFCTDTPPDENRQKLFLKHLDLDAWFIACYAPLMCLLCWSMADVWGREWTWAFTLGRWLAAAQLLAGVLDFVENRGLRLIIEANSISSGSLFVTGMASRLKWTILMMGSAYVLIGFIIWGIWLLRRKTSTN